MLFSFDHDAFQFVTVGTATVSADGMTLKSDPGTGIVKAGWHGSANPRGSGSAQNVSIAFVDCPLTVGVGETVSVSALGTPAPANPTNPFTWTVTGGSGQASLANQVDAQNSSSIDVVGERCR